MGFSTSRLLMGTALVTAMGFAQLTVKANVLIDGSSPGYYNDSLGTILDGTQPQFPLPYFSGGGDPTINPAAEPSLAAAAGVLDDWLSSPPVLNANWTYEAGIPSTWALNTETAIVYPVFVPAPGLSNVVGDFDADNGLFVWVNGQYKFGAIGSGLPSPAGQFEYTNINLGVFPPGTNYVQVLRQDNGIATGYQIRVTGQTGPPPPDAGTNGFAYAQFTPDSCLNLVGAAALTNNLLRVSPAREGVIGAAWHCDKVPVANGFETQFRFRISDIGGWPNLPQTGGDGFGFIVQNVAPDATTTNFAIETGLETNSFCITFNTFWNWPGVYDPEPGDNFIGVLVNQQWLSVRDLTPQGINLSDGAEHVGRVVFDGDALSVSVDGVLVLSNVTSGQFQTAYDPNGRAWVGFGARGGAAWENHDILQWQFGGNPLQTPLPSITQQPEDQEVLAGSTVAFSVAATGAAPLAYQWRFNGDAIGGAVASSLVLSNVQAAQAGYYSVIVSNAAGMVVSSNAMLTVVPVVTQMLVEASSPGFYNDSLGTILDGTQPQFPLPYFSGGGDPNIYPAAEPNLAPAAGILGDWLGLPPVLNGNWTWETSIPSTWALNTETAIIYVIDGGANGIANARGDFDADNGLFVWVNGQYKFGAIQPGAVSPAGQFEYANVDLGNLLPGTNYVQVLRQDNGISVGYKARIYSVSSGPANPPVPTPAGAVSWWRAESNALDSIGSNHGSPVGNVAYTNGLSGQAFNFDGSSYVIVSNSPSLQFTNAITVETWINLRTFSGLNSREIVSKYGGPIPNQYEFTFAVDPALKTAYFIVNSASSYAVVRSATTVPLNQWVHLAGTYDGSAVRIYVNGSVDGETPFSQPIARNDNPLVIGCTLQNFSRPTSFFNGLIDEVTLYNRALASNELAAIYAAGSAGKLPTPVEPPAITQQPVGGDALVGDAVTFNVGVTGSAPLTYRWQFDGSSIPGANGPSLTLNDVQLSDAGAYSVVVSNSAGMVTSSPAALNVIVPNCTAALDGLVGWWPMEDDATDSVGGGQGTLSDVVFASGKVGQAVSFDGATSTMTIPASPVLAVQSFTIEAWVNPRSVSVPRPIVEYSLPTGVGTVQLWYGFIVGGPGGAATAPGGLYGLLRGTNGTALQVGSVPGVLASNQWTHLAMTFDYDSRVALIYANGTLVASNKSAVPINVNTFVPVNIGYRPPGSAELLRGRRHDGLLDEVSIFNRALAANEIASIYSARGTGKCPLPPTILAVTPPAAFVNEGASVSFTTTAAGSPPLSYQWQFEGGDIAGETGSMLSLSNVLFAQAGDYTVVVSGPGGTASSNAVLAVNRAPLANAGATENLLISPNGSNAVAVLDGSLSSDLDGDALSYEWFATGAAVPFANGVVAITSLPLGTNTLMLVVNDGMASGSQDFAVEVITTSQAVDRLAMLAAAGSDGAQSLAASLRAALASIDRNQPDVAINQLEAFKNKVLAQIMPVDPELAGQLLAAAQEIIDALNNVSEPDVALEITSIQRGNSGKPKLSIRGRNHHTYVVEMSTNLSDWTAIGVATKCGDCAFEFEDTQAAGTGPRYYRIVSPK